MIKKNVMRVAAAESTIRKAVMMSSSGGSTTKETVIAECMVKMIIKTAGSFINWQAIIIEKRLMQGI
ncbi:hypothetical protein [Lysinibacillus sp. 3P01SB]|uniref:hypothetical protein n=1 Tax=Lysinibacillus sp. 3P01SB TaxID=3132284 RepID=UPI0039A54BC6